MNWRKLNNLLHRDIGYFFVGMTLIYAISGIALNHMHHWNPNYIIKNENITIKKELLFPDADKSQAKNILKEIGEEKGYKFHYYPNETNIIIFIKGGSLKINTETGIGKIEMIKPRPVFKELNFLHYNPGGAWLWFSDIFSFSLIVLAITGMFVLRGKKGLKGRGKWFVSAGVLLPILFLIFYY